jgi:hypothetical protein
MFDFNDSGIFILDENGNIVNEEGLTSLDELLNFETNDPQYNEDYKFFIDELKKIYIEDMRKYISHLIGEREELPDDIFDLPPPPAQQSPTNSLVDFLDGAKRKGKLSEEEKQARSIQQARNKAEKEEQKKAAAEERKKAKEENKREAKEQKAKRIEEKEARDEAKARARLEGKKKEEALSNIRKQEREERKSERKKNRKSPKKLTSNDPNIIPDPEKDFTRYNLNSYYRENLLGIYDNPYENPVSPKITKNKYHEFIQTTRCPNGKRRVTRSCKKRYGEGFSTKYGYKGKECPSESTHDRFECEAAPRGNNILKNMNLISYSKPPRSNRKLYIDGSKPRTLRKSLRNYKNKNNS